MNTEQSLTRKEVGLSTLVNLSTTGKLNQWMFETIRTYVSGRVLEIGSGIGNISQLFVQNGISLTLSDLNRNYCALLQKKFIGEPMVRGVYQLDLAHSDFTNAYSELLESFDTVFALNVVEHIQDDCLALANCKLLLRPRGRVILLVPAYRALYNRLDRGLEHYRRYNRRTLEKLLSKGFNVEKSWHFNLAGMAGWWWSGSVLGKGSLPAGQLTVYNKLVPLFRVADSLVFNKIGLSVIAVGQKR